MANLLQSIPAKRYFTIGEVGELCDVKPHVLRYWEQEFTQLRPMKRRGNRRYYQRHEVLMIRRIRELLYDHGFTISGARNKLQDGAPDSSQEVEINAIPNVEAAGYCVADSMLVLDFSTADSLQVIGLVKRELLEIRDLLS